MLPFFQHHLQHLEQLVGKLPHPVPLHAEKLGPLQSLFENLIQDEAKMAALLNGQRPPDSEPGNVEFGWVLYVLNNPPPEFKGIIDLLKALGIRIPPTRITPADLKRWESILATSGVCDSEGNMVQEARFAALDPGWAYSLILYVVYKADFLGLDKPHFGDTPQIIPIGGRNSLKIAILGDWGTGEWPDGNDPLGPAIAVRDRAAALKPDIAIHLGDVYYAGTQKGFLDLGKGEEQNNFISLWKPAPLGNFTLNSNHEMYDAGNGYFNIALKSAFFQQQKGTSYFAIEFGNWLIIGLDSAYHDPSNLYMDGSIDPQQVQFIQSLPLQGKKAIVLTHHNPVDYTGTTIVNDGKPNCLWAQVCGALGRAPDFWYWGHLHDGIVYSKNSPVGQRTNARCVGHSAFPFGLAYGLLSNPNDPNSPPIPNVEYFAHTPIKTPTPQQTNRVYNGFAAITLGADSITEDFYDLGSNNPVWSKTTPI